MSLGIYQTPNPDSLVSSGDLLNPVIFKSDNAGEVEERKLYLRHSSLSGPEAEFSADVSVRGLDISTLADDVDSWIQIAPDSAGSPGTYGAAGAAVNLGNVNLGETVPFWVKVTVPVNNEIGARDDLVLNLTSDSSFQNLDVMEGQGDYTGDAFFDPTVNGGSISFVYFNSGDTGTYTSTWFDVTPATKILPITYNITGGTAYIEYRTADSSTGTGATAWVVDTEDITLKDFLQFRITFYGEAVNNFPTGLTRFFYNGTSFGTLLSTSEVGTPVLAAITGNRSHRWTGYLNAAQTGNYTFTIVSRDGHRLFINGTAIINNFVGGSAVTSSATVALAKGFHAIEYQHYDGGGDDAYINTTITVPGGTSRPPVASDYVRDISLIEKYIRVSNVKVNYLAPVNRNYDMRFYIGPATPELLDPPNGMETEEFNPLLTAVSAQTDFIQFQLDNVMSFDSSNLTTFEVQADDDEPVSAQSPIFDRPPGIWYWRARSKHGGNYGNWSDFRFFEILPFVGQDQFYYLNVNMGVEFDDTIVHERQLYINASIGVEEQDIYLFRHLYHNVNIGTGVGEVIYPLFDNTFTRKQTFSDDGDEFT